MTESQGKLSKMNHHLPAMPHGPPSMPPSRRQQEFSYNSIPPNMRSSQYIGYPPHMNGHIPQPYQQPPYAQWYAPYGHPQLRPQYQQQHYGPMIVSSYPHAQPVMAPTHLPPHSMHMQRASTPQQPVMTPPVLLPSISPMQPEIQAPPHLSHPVQGYPAASPPPRWEPKYNVPPKPAFAPPVSSFCFPVSPIPFGLCQASDQ